MVQAATTDRDAMELAVNRFFHMANTHCPGNLAPLLTPDVLLLADQEAKGEEAVHAYFVFLWESYPELTFRVENVIVDGAAAAAEVSYEHGPQGTGARCFTFQFKQGRIRRIRCY